MVDDAPCRRITYRAAAHHMGTDDPAQQGLQPQVSNAARCFAPGGEARRFLGTGVTRPAPAANWISAIASQRRPPIDIIERVIEIGRTIAAQLDPPPRLCGWKPSRTSAMVTWA